MAEARTPAERESWDRNGFVILPGFADAAVLRAMEARVVELVRSADAGCSGDHDVSP